MFLLKRLMITAFYAGLLGMLYFKISLDTIRARVKHKISLGVGLHGEIERYVSAHGNFAAYTAMLLLQLFFLESIGKWPPYVLHIFGGCITVGRIFHYGAFRSESMNFKLRTLGMQLTLWPLILMSILNVGLFLAHMVLVALY